MGCSLCGGNEKQFCDNCRPPWDEFRMEGFCSVHEENYDKAARNMLELHAKALACHCECLGMNAENMWAAIANADPVYKSEDYYKIMHKWGLSDEKGNSII